MHGTASRRPQKGLLQKSFGIQGAPLANLGARCRSGLVPKKGVTFRYAESVVIRTRNLRLRRARNNSKNPANQPLTNLIFIIFWCVFQVFRAPACRSRAGSRRSTQTLRTIVGACLATLARSHIFSVTCPEVHPTRCCTCVRIGARPAARPAPRPDLRRPFLHAARCCPSAAGCPARLGKRPASLPQVDAREAHVRGWAGDCAEWGAA